MGEILASLPGQIQTHIKAITQSAGLPDNDQSYEQLAQGWKKKLELFEEQIKLGGMADVESLAKDDSRGCVALTYSGSLILVGPLEDAKRKCAYNSIGVRKDVPESVTKEDSSLAADIAIDAPVVFENGPVKSTSSIFKIAVVQADLTVIEEEEQINAVTVILTEGFVDVNQALVPIN